MAVRSVATMALLFAAGRVNEKSLARLWWRLLLPGTTVEVSPRIVVSSF
jgi:hypothetical protein